jgi:heme exporter protein CcmD
MAEHHWNFIAVAYGLSALAIVVEIVGLLRRRRQALDRAARERDFDEDERGA